MKAVLPMLANFVSDLTIASELLEYEHVFENYFKIDRKQRKLIFKYIQYKYIIKNFNEAFKEYNADKAESTVVYNYVTLYKEMLKEL